MDHGQAIYHLYHHQKNSRRCCWRDAVRGSPEKMTLAWHRHTAWKPVWPVYKWLTPPSVAPSCQCLPCMRSSCWCYSWSGILYQWCATKKSSWPRNVFHSEELLWTLECLLHWLSSLDAAWQRLHYWWNLSRLWRYNSRLVSSLHCPSVGRSRPGMRYHGNHHLGLSNILLTRVMALYVSDPCSSTLGTPGSILR